METGPWIQSSNSKREGEAVVTGLVSRSHGSHSWREYSSDISAKHLRRISRSPRAPPEAAAALPALPPEYSAVLPAQPQLDPFGSHAKIRNRRGLPAISLLVLSKSECYYYRFAVHADP
jgi:hypothetical protein